MYTNYLYYIGFGLMSRVFTNGLGNQGAIPGQVLPMIQKMVLKTVILHKKKKIVIL